MDLRQVLRALENIKTEQHPEGIIISMDLGVHAFCLIDSNCPRAVQLREILSQAEIPLDALLEAHNSIEQPEPNRLDWTLPDIETNINIVIAGKTSTFDANEIVEGQVKEEITYLLGNLRSQHRQVESLAASLHHAYLTEIRKVRTEIILPQLRYEPADLLMNRCIVNAQDNYYTYSLPLVYNPQYIVRSRVRYKLGAIDVDRLRHDTFVRYIIGDRSTFQSITLVNRQGSKFNHYHGTSYDCWGDVQLPERWDGRIGTLARLAHTLETSLITINADSLMTSEPIGLINIHDLIDRGERLGEEGSLPARDEEDYLVALEVDTAGATNTDNPHANRWGAARRD